MNEEESTMQNCVYLDDVRTPPLGWTLVRNAEDCITLLKTTTIGIISLDHDLGENEKDGYTVALWIEERAVNEPKWVPPLVLCHSDNPPGRQRICAAASNINKLRLARMP